MIKINLKNKIKKKKYKLAFKKLFLFYWRVNIK